MQSSRFFLASFLFLAWLSTLLPARVLAFDFGALETVVNKAVRTVSFPEEALP